MPDRAATLERLGTGSSPLDTILGGGLPARSVTVVAGQPGSGKTVFTLQALFHHARQGKKCLYFSTLSEPALKTIRYVQAFSFFDARLIEDRLVFVDLGSALRNGGPEKALQPLIDRVESEGADLVAIDSFKAIHDLMPDISGSRMFVYDLAVGMAAWGATTLLVGEYTAEEIGTAPEFAIADGIVQLTNERQELTAARQFEVLKLRGANYVTGRHFFEIGAEGVTFYPRVRGPAITDDPPVDLTDRVTTGVPGLDELLRGGLPRASTTIVEGGTGTGKTLVGLHFLLEGARRERAGDPVHAGGDPGSDPSRREELRVRRGPAGGPGPPRHQLHLPGRAPHRPFPRRGAAADREGGRAPRGARQPHQHGAQRRVAAPVSRAGLRLDQARPGRPVSPC